MDPQPQPPLSFLLMIVNVIVCVLSVWESSRGGRPTGRRKTVRKLRRSGRRLEKNDLPRGSL